jgi:TPR repeat protein
VTDRAIPPDRQVPDSGIKVPAPQLVVTQTAPLSPNEALRLGVSLNGPNEGVVLLIGGLAPGSAFSVGRAIGGNWWRVPAAELGNAILTPPRGFVGIMDIAMELRLANDKVADRKSMQLEWAAPSTVPEPASTERRLDANEIASLLNRAGQFVAKGDLAAARSLFQRAAEAGDARAAFALAETYDPMALQRRGEQGFAPDIAKARTWYERAREYGSGEASQRLQMLGSQDG